MSCRKKCFLILILLLLEVSVCQRLPVSVMAQNYEPVAVSRKSLLAIIDFAKETMNYGPYLEEILKAEGYVDFDVSDLSSADLNDYSLIILAKMNTSTSEIMLLNYVSNGGVLVALKPDISLAEAFGLKYLGGNIEEGYIEFNSTLGLVDEPIQFHGSADIYDDSGWTRLATINGTKYSAVTARRYGNGTIVIFTYDLAECVALMRQGNPEWAGYDRDGNKVLQPADMFVNSGGSGWWTNPDKVRIPQADEHQRLLTKIIERYSNQPIPRIWYFPDKEKCIFVYSGDTDGATWDQCQQQMNDVKTRGGLFTLYSKDWYDSSYIKSWRANGYEIAIHFNLGAYDYPSMPWQIMWNHYDNWIQRFLNSYGPPAPETVRNHIVSWCGNLSDGTQEQTAQAQIELLHGIRLDENYYMTKNLGGVDSGYFTGSGLPQRFISTNGTLLDIYQLLTNIGDDTYGASDLEYATKHLINKSLENEDYAFVHVNYHPVNYAVERPYVLNVLDYCVARSVPIWRSIDVLRFTDQRRAITFSTPLWNGTQLTFQVIIPASASNFTIMLPDYKNLTVYEVRVNDVLTTTSKEKVKGTNYAFVTLPTGTYSVTASYAEQPTAPNNPPVASELRITPSLPYDEVDLVGSYTYSDADGNPESGTEIRWYKNGILQPDYNDKLTVSSPSTAAGEVWYFTVRPKDGKDFGDLKTSPSVTIRALAPSLFSDGFESGDFSAWTSTRGLPSVTSINAHHGTYEAVFDAPSEYCYKEYGGQSTVYSRVYIYITQHMQGGYSSPFLWHYGTGGTEIVELRLFGNDLDLRYREGANWETSTYPTADLQTNRWYCIELKTVVHGTVGEYRVYLDGTERITVTGKDSDNYGNVFRTYVGKGYDYGSPKGTLNIDCVEVSDRYIGPEGVEVEDRTPPAYSDVGAKTTLAGQPCLFHTKWTDDTSLSGYIFSTNNTGTWINDTWTRLSGRSAWSNVTKILSSTVGVLVQYRFYCNDTSNNWGVTPIQSLTLPPQEPETIKDYWQFTFRHTDLDANIIDDRITWELYNGTQLLNYKEGQYSLQNGTYILRTYYHGELLNQTYLDTAVHGNSTILLQIYMKRHSSVSGGYIAFNGSITSVAILSQTDENLTVTVEGSNPVSMIVDVPRSCSYVQRNDVNVTNWIYVLGDSGYIRVGKSTLSKWEFYFPKKQTPKHWQFTFNHIDLDGNVVDSIVTWQLYNGSESLSYNEGGYTLLNGTYTLKTYYHGLLINETDLETATQGNSTVTVDLSMKPHQSAPRGYIALNTTLTSTIIHAQTNENLTFSVEGLSPALVIVDVPRNCSYIQRNDVNQTGWKYVKESIGSSYVFIGVPELSKWEYYFPATEPKPQPAIFGKTSIGAIVTAAPVGYVLASRFQAPADGTATLISAYVRGRFQTGLVKAFIYSDADGKADSLLLESGQITLRSSWAWHNFSINCHLQAGKYYWFAIFTSIESQHSYDTSLTKQQAVAWGWVYPNAPAKFNGVYEPSYRNNVDSIYITYNPAGPPPPDTQLPTYGNIGTSTTVASNLCQFSCYWKDDTGLSAYVFSTNATGAWLNDTLTGLSGMESWANVTKTLNSKVGVVIGYRWYCVDLNSNWRDTGVQTLTTTYSAKPQYSNISYNATEQGQPCLFSCLWKDDQRLGGYIFGINSSGTWKNETWAPLSGSQSWANKIGILPSRAGVRVEFQWWCNDSQGQWNTTGLRYLITTSDLPPMYRNIRTNTTVAGSVALFSCYWQDNRGLSGFIFSWNGTGSWKNDTWTALNGVYAWANVTKTLDSTVGTVIGFKWYCNDTSNNLNSTKTQTLTTTGRSQSARFGKTSIGVGVNTLPVGYVVACRFQAPEDGTATLISAYIRGRYKTGLAKALIYSDLNGKADSLLFETQEITLLSSWAWHNFSVNYDLKAGKYYWFAIFMSVESQFRYDTGVANQQAVAWGWTYPKVPTKFSGVYGPSYSSVEDSIYVTYNPA